MTHYVPHIPSGPGLGKLGLVGQLTLGFRLGARHYPALLAVALVVDVPLALLGLVGQRADSALLGFALGFPLVALVNPVAKAATVVAVDTALRTGRISPVAAYRPVLAHAGVLVLACVLWLVAVLAGLAFLLIPGLIALVAGQCLVGAVVLEGRGLRAAVVRSWRLVRPAFWSVLALFIALEVVGGVGGWLADVLLAPLYDASGPWDGVAAVISRAWTSPFVYAGFAVLFLDRAAAERAASGPAGGDADPAESDAPGLDR